MSIIQVSLLEERDDVDMMKWYHLAMAGAGVVFGIATGVVVYTQFISVV